MKNKTKKRPSSDLYTYRIEWSEQDGAHLGRCLEFPSLSAHGSTSEQALREIQSAVRASLTWLHEEGETIPEPLGKRKFKGNISLRVSEELHRQLVIRSNEEGVSLNQYLLSKLGTV